MPIIQSSESLLENVIDTLLLATKKLSADKVLMKEYRSTSLTSQITKAYLENAMHVSATLMLKAIKVLDQVMDGDAS